MLRGMSRYECVKKIKNPRQVGHAPVLQNVLLPQMKELPPRNAAHKLGNHAGGLSETVVTSHALYLCEDDCIQYFWGAAERYAQENCDYTGKVVLRTVPVAFAAESVATIRK